MIIPGLAKFVAELCSEVQLAGLMASTASLRLLTRFIGAVALFSGAACSSSDAHDAANAAPTGKNIGVNVSTINTWDGSRPFMNLILGSSWQSRDRDGAGRDIAPSQLDSNGWVKSLPDGHWAIRTLYSATDAEIVCRWNGNDHGSMQVFVDGGEVRQRRERGANELRFRYTLHRPRDAALPSIRYTVDATDYVRNLDCREAGAKPEAIFDPVFLQTLAGFSVIRFMKWQAAVEANTAVSWAGRNTPASGDYLGNDGVPVEVMVELANEAGADPWFSMPWNADDDYVARFATYVRDNLRPGRRAYVEVSNEVWNGSYPVMHQAQREGIAEGLDRSNGEYGQAMARYAEKTRQVMQIWSKVFIKQPDRLVRVASAQNVSPFWSERIIAYSDTASSIDALATAPYWGLGDDEVRGKSLDEIMSRTLPAKIAESLDWAEKQKAIAAKYGKRYIAYEGGQHVWLNDNQSLVAQIERDPRMYDLYKSYIDRWNREIGDTLTLFALTGGIGKAGFGLVEYAGQPLSEAPKMRAVQDRLRWRSK